MNAPPSAEQRADWFWFSLRKNTMYAPFWPRRPGRVCRFVMWALFGWVCVAW